MFGKGSGPTAVIYVEREELVAVPHKMADQIRSDKTEEGTRKEGKGKQWFPSGLENRPFQRGSSPVRAKGRKEVNVASKLGGERVLPARLTG